MNILFIGKRFYTNRDALREKFGRIYQLPWHWAQAGIPTRLWMVDYHSRESAALHDGQLDVASTPVRNLAVLRAYRAESRRLPKPEAVIASGDCYIGLMAYRLARNLGARFVFDVYDKYDEFGGYLKIPGFDPLPWLLRKADLCWFASRPLMKQIGRNSHNKALVPNGIDTKLFQPADLRTSRARLGIPLDTPYVGYFGSMTPDRGVDDLVAALQSLRRHNNRVCLLLAGGQRLGPKRSEPWIRDLGNLPYDQVPTAMACCNVLALPYRRSSYLDMAASCKIAEYIAVRRPLAVTDTPNFSENFPAQAAELGPLLAAADNPRDLARVIGTQLELKRLVTLPTDLGWGSIAAGAADGARLISDNPHRRTAREGNAP